MSGLKGAGLAAIGAMLALIGALTPQAARADATTLHRAFENQLLNRLEISWNIPDFHRMLTMPDPAPSAVVAGTFDQALDHANAADKRTFKQRYYIDSSNATDASSPVIYYICGEAVCDPRELQGAVQGYARTYHAHLVALEHRFYGMSQPFGDLSIEHLKYLSMDQALEDLAVFQRYLQDQKGLKGKWISVGGSYPGSLSAYYREKNPTLVAGSLASSAPVEAREAFEMYDYTVAHQVTPECADAMRDTVKQIEAAIPDATKFAAIKTLFKADAVVDPIDFLYIVADMGAMSVQYGQRDQFCRTILDAGADHRVEGYAKAGVSEFALFGMTPLDDSFQAIQSLNPNDYLKFAGMRQWFYQSCTEWGFFQVAYHDPAQSVRSPKIDLPFHHSICERFLGVSGPVPIADVNQKYYAPLLDAQQTSNIMMTNGSTDPWSMLSITQANGNASNPNLTLYTVQGGSHCSDLSPERAADSDSLKGARTTFAGLLKSWF